MLRTLDYSFLISMESTHSSAFALSLSSTLTQRAINPFTKKPMMMINMKPNSEMSMVGTPS